MIGQNGNHQCFRIASTSFEYLWINILCANNEIIATKVFEYKSIQNLNTKSWKSIELEKMHENERIKCQPHLNFIRDELIRMRASVVMHMDANELADEKFPIQFYNIDIEQTERNNEAKTNRLKAEKEKLDKIFNDEQLNIERVRKNVIDCFKVDRLRVRTIFMEVFIENYALTHLDRKFINDETVEKIIKHSEIIKRFQNLQIGVRQNLLSEKELRWLRISADTCSEVIERFTAAVAKVIDLQLSTHTSWTHDFTSAIGTDHRIDNITDEMQVIIYNIRVYVSNRFLYD